MEFASKSPQNPSRGFGGIKCSKVNTVSSSFRDSPLTSSSEPSRNCTPDNKYDEYMPAVLLNSLKKDKKPFTYTPGRVDLSEVLNAKLQKRLANKKARSPQPILDDPTKQVLVMPTYNSPLNMYSMENALEALEVQAELTIKDRSLENGSMTLPRNYKFEAKDFEPKNVTQSKAFRVLQIITDTEDAENEQSQKINSTSLEEQQKFSGIRDSSVIPSKLFHNLQKITNTDEDNVTWKNKVGQKTNMIPHEEEVRFSGIRENSAIPSKLFHNLQKITHTEPVAKNVNQTNKVIFHGKSPVHENSFTVPKFQTRNCNGVGETYNKNPVLKRPAAFLPAKSQIMPVTKYTNGKNVHGSSNRVLRPFEGTDF